MRKLVVTTIFALSLAACAGPSEDLSRCYQTYEFGNFGCAELTGLVTDPQGVPIAQAFVGMRGPVQSGHPAALTSGPGRTDSTGSYRLRTIRMSSEPPTDGPDTVTVWVWAAVSPPPEAPIGTPGPVDSVLATREMRPIGELPVVTEVETIAVPLPQ